jgi:hypothetical protein
MKPGQSFVIGDSAGHYLQVSFYRAIHKTPKAAAKKKELF